MQALDGADVEPFFLKNAGVQRAFFEIERVHRCYLIFASIALRDLPYLFEDRVVVNVEARNRKVALGPLRLFFYA